MNPKYRALLWEEYRAGRIRFAMAFCSVGALVLAGFYLLGIVLPMPFVVFGMPLWLCLLMTIPRPKSAPADPELAPRLLRLPIETPLLVGFLLFTRLTLIMGIAGLLSGVYTELLGRNVPIGWTFLAGASYLCMQTLAWLYRPIPAMAVVGYALLFLAIPTFFFWQVWPEPQIPMAGVLANWLPASLLLAVSMAVAFGVNVWAVGATHRGVRLGIQNRFHSSETFSLPGFLRPGRFPTPFAAQVWWEIRANAMYFPLYACAMIGLMAALMIFPLLTFQQGEGASSFGFTSLLLPWGPLWAILFTAIMFNSARWGVPTARKSSISTFAFSRPLTSAEMAATRLAAFFVALGAALFVATVISTTTVLGAHHAEGWHILSGLSHSGIMRSREIASYLFGFPLLCGLAAWAGTYSFAASAFVWILFFAWPHYTPMAGTFDMSLNNPKVAAVLWILSGAILVETIVSLFLCRRKKLLPAPHLIGCLLYWVAATLFFFPFGSGSGYSFVLAQIPLSAALGAAVILPYPRLTIAIQRIRHGKLAAMSVHGHRHRLQRFRPLAFRLAAGFGLTTISVALAWLRWPETPGYAQFMRTHGCPLTNQDLARMYPPVPPEENLALLYTEISTQFSAKEDAYFSSCRETSASNSSPSSDDPLDQVLIRGYAEADPDRPIPEAVWNATRAYYDAVARDTAAQLQEAAQSGLSKCRYPIWLGQESSFPTVERKWMLRDLCELLFLKSLVASVENRPAEAVDALQALPPLANSVINEPFNGSNSGRLDLLEEGVDGFEGLVNRMELPASGLASMREAFSQVLWSWPITANEGLIEECASAFYTVDPFSAQTTAPYSLGLPFMRQFQGIMGTLPLTKSLIVSCLFDNSSPQDARYAPKEWDESSNRAVSDVYRLLHPPYDDDRHADDRCRARLGQAVTACAVEEFRLAHGRLPENLQALVPELLPEVPEDPMTAGQLLSYKTRPTGGYVISSGEWTEGDLSFCVSPPAERHLPQIEHKDSGTPPRPISRLVAEHKLPSLETVFLSYASGADVHTMRASTEDYG